MAVVAPITFDLTGACHDCCGGECCSCDGTLTFTTSGVTEGDGPTAHDCEEPFPLNCCYCETAFNRSWTLTGVTEEGDCQWQETQGPTILTCNGQTSVTASASCNEGELGVAFAAGADPANIRYFGPMRCDGSPMVLELEDLGGQGEFCYWPPTLVVTYNP